MSHNFPDNVQFKAQGLDAKFTLRRYVMPTIVLIILTVITGMTYLVMRQTDTTRCQTSMDRTHNPTCDNNPDFDGAEGAVGSTGATGLIEATVGPTMTKRCTRCAGLMSRDRCAAHVILDIFQLVPAS